MLLAAPQTTSFKWNFTLVQYCHKQDFDLGAEKRSSNFSQERAFVTHVLFSNGPKDVPYTKAKPLISTARDHIRKDPFIAC